MADVINNENVATEEDLSEQMIIRREKLKALQDDGKDPFVITKYDVTHLSTEAIALLEEKEA
ncbi:MAG: lysine--tRNA ligase, partial [Clostridia bacterium]|nr:lysine--tRNA ligase [Clostridia bacterium]